MKEDKSYGKVTSDFVLRCLRGVLYFKLDTGIPRLVRMKRIIHCPVTLTSHFDIFQTNAARGVIAAICCAAFFIILSLIVKYRWRPDETNETREVYTRRDSGLKMEPMGQDNPAMEKSE